MKLFDCFKNCFAGAASAETKSQDESAKSQNSKFVNIEDFAKLDLRAGKILKAEKLEGSDKLVKCEVDFGEIGTRVIVSGIYKHRKPEELEGNSYLYIINLEPRKIFGVESQGMLVALSGNDGSFAMLVPDAEVGVGAKAG